MREAYAAVRGAGTGRLLLGLTGLGLGLVGLWQFVAHVPTTGWVRVVVWLWPGSSSTTACSRRSAWCPAGWSHGGHPSGPARSSASPASPC